MVAKRAIFLDKDGTLIPNIAYNVNPDLITLNPGVAKGLSLLQSRFLLIVITNQDGVANGKFGEKEVDLVMDKMNALLKEKDVHLDGFFYCPHHPDGNTPPFNVSCECRKPQSGLLLKAAESYHINLSQSWMIGDILNDVEAGNGAGCRSILIDNGNETEWKIDGNKNRIPELICTHFLEAVEHILKSEKELSHAERL